MEEPCILVRRRLQSIQQKLCVSPSALGCLTVWADCDGGKLKEDSIEFLEIVLDQGIDEGFHLNLLESRGDVSALSQDVSVAAEEAFDVERGHGQGCGHGGQPHQPGGPPAPGADVPQAVDGGEEEEVSDVQRNAVFTGIRLGQCTVVKVAPL